VSGAATSTDGGGPITSGLILDGQVLRIALARPPRNILDAEMLGAIAQTIDPYLDADKARHIKALLLTSEGPHFSYGASIAEHSRASAPQMLDVFHVCVRTLVESELPIVAAVRGQCLGAGLELATLASHLCVNGDARLGQPEIKLGAFAPVASVVLPRRIGQGRAEELLLTGRIVGAEEALRISLVDRVVDGDPELAAIEWIRSSLVPLSASSIRYALRAARASWLIELDTVLDEVFHLYRDGLLETEDAQEGVLSFLEKRTPRWRDE
jgi:cyclohexa-1,5-dienecarbonyl-CoA hydratase